MEGLDPNIQSRLCHDERENNDEWDAVMIPS